MATSATMIPVYADELRRRRRPEDEQQTPTERPVVPPPPPGVAQPVPPATMQQPAVASQPVPTPPGMPPIVPPPPPPRSRGGDLAATEDRARQTSAGADAGMLTAVNTQRQQMADAAAAGRPADPIAGLVTTTGVDLRPPTLAVEQQRQALADARQVGAPTATDDSAEVMRRILADMEGRQAAEPAVMAARGGPDVGAGGGETGGGAAGFDFSALRARPFDRAVVQAALDAGVDPATVVRELAQARAGTQASLGERGDALAAAQEVLSFLRGAGGNFGFGEAGTASQSDVQRLLLNAGMEDLVRQELMRNPQIQGQAPEFQQAYQDYHISRLRGEDLPSYSDYIAQLRAAGALPPATATDAPAAGSLPGAAAGDAASATTADLGYEALLREMAAIRDAEERRIAETMAARGVLGGTPELVDQSRLSADLMARYARGLSDLAAQERGFGLQERELELRRRAMEADINFRERQLELMRVGMDRDEAYRQAQAEWERERFGMELGQRRSEFDRGLTQREREFSRAHELDRREFERRLLDTLVQYGFTREQAEQFLRSMGLPGSTGGVVGEPLTL